MRLEKWEVDPDKINLSKKYGQEFRIDVHFRKVCKVCDSSKRPKDLCADCSMCMKHSDLPFWEIIGKILDVSNDMPSLTQNVIEPRLSRSLIRDIT